MLSKARLVNWRVHTAYAAAVTVASLKWNCKISLSALPATLNGGCGWSRRPNLPLKSTCCSAKTSCKESKLSVGYAGWFESLLLPDSRSKLSSSSLTAVTSVLQKNLQKQNIKL